MGASKKPFSNKKRFSDLARRIKELPEPEVDLLQATIDALNKETDDRLKTVLAKAKKIKGSGKDYGQLTVEALNRALKSEKPSSDITDDTQDGRPHTA